MPSGLINVPSIVLFSRCPANLPKRNKNEMKINKAVSFARDFAMQI